jgi:hypothetical protein
MNEGTITAANSPNLGDRPGLRYGLLRGSEGEQKVDCYECNANLTFKPEDLYWLEPDRQFETCEVKCSVCGKQFELTAANDKDIEYDFFGDLSQEVSNG